MAVTVRELFNWIGPLPLNSLVAVDQGGLTLVAYRPDATMEERVNADTDPETSDSYFEIGGVNIGLYVPARDAF